jgi:signal transduction histidine kinase
MAASPTAVRQQAPGRWAGTRVDAWLAAGLAVLAVIQVLLFPVGPPYEPVTEGRLLLAVLGPAALLWRQTAPLVAQAGTSGTVVVNAAAGYPIGFLDWPAWIALFSCFDIGGRRVRTAATVIAALGIAGYVSFDRAAPVRQLPGIIIHFSVAMVVGELSSRRTKAVVAEARRGAESREQALAAERLLLQERTRLARELHDSLGHTVNVMVLQAGVGRRVFADNPTFAQQALSSIETVGRAALDELTASSRCSSRTSAERPNRSPRRWRTWNTSSNGSGRRAGRWTCGPTTSTCPPVPLERCTGSCRRH